MTAERGDLVAKGWPRLGLSVKCVRVLCPWVLAQGQGGASSEGAEVRAAFTLLTAAPEPGASLRAAGPSVAPRVQRGASAFLAAAAMAPLLGRKPFPW